MHVQITHGAFEQGPAAQGKKSHQLHHRKATARLLRSRLRPEGLVRFRVWHTQIGPIDNLHRAASQPTFLFQDITFQAPAKMLRDEFQGLQIKPRARLTIGARRTAQADRPAGPMLPPSFDPPNHLAAGAART